MANINKEKKYHFIYKTTNLLNGKYYVGMHSTSNMKDGYLGSGTRLRRAIRKYGKENFRLEILEFFDSREALVLREKELVNEALLKDEMCMNLKPGGSGGFCNEEHAYKYHAAGGKRVRQLLSEKHCNKLKTDAAYKEWYLSKCKGNNYWKGKKHSIETIVRMKEKKAGFGTGESNSQFGTCWITDGLRNRKIKKTDLLPHGWKYGRVL
jgi:hypothetical protein